MYKKFLQNRLFLSTTIIAVCLSMGLSLAWQQVDSQTKPVALGDLLTGLRSKLVRSMAEKNETLAGAVKQRGVDFELTPQIEKILREEGANDVLINAIREKSRKPVPESNGSVKAGTISKATLPGNVGMSFAYIPAGEFQMGSNTSDDEKPIHTVKISQGFYMQTTEVTQAQWKAIMGGLPSKCDWGELKGDFLGDKKPIICVSWDDAQQYIAKLNGQNDGYKYRLPTEAEWEYAARAGTTGDYAGNLDSMAWYSSNSGSKTHEVGTKSPNGWGLYDMYGNVWEWVQDWYDSGYYAKSPGTDPTGPASGSYRVFRGGGWYVTAEYLRSANRSGITPSNRYNYLGFRVVRQ